MFITVLVSILSGIGAGIGTGLAGLSAALIIAPALMTFCDMPAYESVTIALASDVLASAISAWTYAKRKNLDVKNGVVLLLSILVFTLVGSYIGQFAPNTIVKYFAIFMVCTIGLKFIIWPVMTSKTEMANTPFAQRAVKSIFFGAIIGFICGVVGKDGGDLRCDEGGGDAEEHDPQVGLSAQGEVRDSAKQGGEGHNEHTGADGGF